MELGNLGKVGVLAAVVGLALAACGGQRAADDSRTLTLAVVADVTSWDPAQAHVGHRLQPYQPVYDTLILREPDGTLSPMLATGWAYNDDRTELTLDLRTDVTFSDGTTFDAAATKANLEHFKAANGRQAAQLASFESAEIVDADTVKINLTAPDPAFEYYLSQAAGLMGSPAAIAAGTIATTPVGTGPYVYDPAQSLPGSQLAFTARQGYWNPALQKFDKIVLKAHGRDHRAAERGGVGDLADATLVDARTVAQAEGAGLTVLEDYQVDWQGLLLFDRGGTLVPALGDVRVRQAINYAIDRKTLLEPAAARLRHSDRAGLRTVQRRLRRGARRPLPLRPGEGASAARGGGLRGRLRHESPRAPGVRHGDRGRRAAAGRGRDQGAGRDRGAGHLRRGPGRRQVSDRVLQPVPGRAVGGDQPA